MRRSALLVVAAAGILVVAACGDDDGGGSPLGGDTDIPEDVQDEIDEQLEDLDEDLEELGGDVDACSLLTVDEIETEVGNAVDDGISSFGSCTWSSEAEETSVTVSLLEIPEMSFCVDALMDDPGYSEVDGFDDPAYVSSNDSGSIPQADVVVCTDSGQFQVVVTGGFDDTQSADDVQAQAEALTELAVDRL